MGSGGGGGGSGMWGGQQQYSGYTGPDPSSWQTNLPYITDMYNPWVQQNMPLGGYNGKPTYLNAGYADQTLGFNNWGWNPQPGDPEQQAQNPIGYINGGWWPNVTQSPIYSRQQLGSFMDRQPLAPMTPMPQMSMPVTDSTATGTASTGTGTTSTPSPGTGNWGTNNPGSSSSWGSLLGK
jgi:hypothetical protein